MEEQFKNEDRVIRKLITEAGLEKPTAGFNVMVMEKLEAKDQAKAIYRPLISTKGWFVVIAAVVAAMAVLYLFPSGILEQPQLDGLIGKWGPSFPEMKFSKTLVYGMLFLSLFIFQVPLLKRLLERRIR